MFEDIYSRTAVGWDVYEQESGDLAAGLLQRIVMTEQCFEAPPVLHSDNGAPMKSLTLLAKMYNLGITRSRGRPLVSNDNPYSESWFRTLKYCNNYLEKRRLGKAIAPNLRQTITGKRLPAALSGGLWVYVDGNIYVAFVGCEGDLRR